MKKGKEMANKETLDTDKKKNSASAIVKYHNELNQVNFGSFSPVELDIFFAIISKMRDKKTDEVKMPLRELREMINYPVRGDKKISSDIARAYKKFFDLSYYNH
ncbi:MAG: replication initiation protein, partial [Lachnospiraceae bacterium]|nr:replication initiation protein [Lachnospiraceae bacterium]